MASSTSLLRGCSTARVARTKPGLACAGIPHQCRSSSSFTGRRCNHVPRHGTLAPKASSRLSRGAPARAASEQAAGPSQEEAARRKAEMNEETIRMLSFMPDSHYAFLGVTPWAPADEIKTTYRRLSKQYHPDTTKIQDKREAARLFNKLQNAYQTLSDDQRRATYDLSLQIKELKKAGRYQTRPQAAMDDDEVMFTQSPFAPPDASTDDPYDNERGIGEMARLGISFDVLAILVALMGLLFVYIRDGDAIFYS